MFKKLFKRATPGQMIILMFLLVLLVFFLKDAGITTILIVVGSAVIMSFILLPWSNVKEFDEEDIIDWKLVNKLSNKDD